MNKVLIVDDDQTFCDALQRSMRRRHFEVETAQNVSDAIKKAEQIQPDYAVVDLRIGDESGLKVVEALAKTFENIHMIVLTGFASITTAVQAIKLGAVQYLTKPADTDDIIKAMQHNSADADVKIPENPMSPRRLEWEHIQSVLAQHDGNISATARALGLHRRSLQRKLQKKPMRL